MFVPFDTDRAKFQEYLPVKTIPRPGLIRCCDGKVLDQNLGQSVKDQWLEEWEQKKTDKEWPALADKKGKKK